MWQNQVTKVFPFLAGMQMQLAPVPGDGSCLPTSIFESILRALPATHGESEAAREERVRLRREIVKHFMGQSWAVHDQAVAMLVGNLCENVDLQQFVLQQPFASLKMNLVLFEDGHPPVVYRPPCPGPSTRTILIVRGANEHGHPHFSHLLVSSADGQSLVPSGSSEGELTEKSAEVNEALDKLKTTCACTELGTRSSVLDSFAEGTSLPRDLALQKLDEAGWDAGLAYALLFAFD